MLSIKDRSLALFRNGYNCAQSVLLPFAEIMDADLQAMEKLSLGFGGGMGRLQKTCGAVTGAFMVISLYCSTLDKEVQGQESRRLIQEFHVQFIAIHKVSDCRSLLGSDLNTEEGLEYVAEQKLSEFICEQCIKDSVNILINIMRDL